MAVVAANVAVIHDGEILLTKRDDFQVWCLPSGAVESGESIAQAAIRETREETGLEVQLTRLVGVYSRLGPWEEIHAVLFLARPIGGKLRTQVGETIEVRYFKPSEIPNELLYGQRQRILDALSNIRKAIVRLQKLSSPSEQIKTREDVYELRDRSGLTREEFYMKYLEQCHSEENLLEVGGE
jgi:ADP-ribose pyrophosphatase YjhB (NUDIX family)